MTAEASATDTDTAHDLRLITDTNLAQFDTCLEYRSQILHQLTEINSSVCCKVKKDFIVVKCIFRINQLHLQFVLGNLLKADLKCVFLFLFILAFNLIVFRCCKTNDSLQRLYHFAVVYFTRCNEHMAIFNTSRSLHNHILPHFYIQIQRVKIIDLTCVSESHANYLYHFNSPLLLIAASPS